MFKPNEQFAAANQTAVNLLLTVANTSLASVERLAALNLNTARAILADSAANVGSLLSAKDPQSLLALQTKLAKPAIEQAVAYSRSVYEILSQSSTGLSDIVAGQTAELKKNFAATMDQSLKHAPAGSEAVVAAMRSGIAAAGTAYDNMTNAAKQATAQFEANVASAGAAANRLISKAA
jgi:phasin family protein